MNGVTLYFFLGGGWTQHTFFFFIVLIESPRRAYKSNAAIISVIDYT